ncbi:MAG: RIO1 family regulatory kinase/ATPase [Lysobacterales bacterium]
MNTSTQAPPGGLPVELERWIESSLASGSNILATSNQGIVLLYEGETRKLVIKSAMGRGPVRRARQATLEREYAAYRRLSGVEGVPACYGLLAGRYLVMEFIDGTPYRHATWQDRDEWFAQLLVVIRAFHSRGVSHGDLKSKTNMIVGVDEKPYIIDFGTTFMRKDGFHPVNNHLFEYGKRLDINAWVKHKYHGRYKNASEEDRQLLNYSKLEWVVRKLRGRPMH